MSLRDCLAQVGELLSRDVLLFVDLPDLVCALVGQAGIFGLFNFDPQLLELRRQPVRRLRRCVVLAAEILFDVILQVRIDDLSRELRVLRFEFNFDQAAVGTRFTLRRPRKAPRIAGRLVAPLPCAEGGYHWGFRRIPDSAPDRAT